ncbi:OmpH family outer membrane protein [Undibacterium sp. SXout7W]|uniref:OmpH family outer membrane protein n=1 Tax=Undibacterium sp. SXout7W TaxID=3413049 RepID=UPI003BF2541E
MLSQLITPSRLLQRLMICAACFASVATVQAQDSKVAIFDSQRVMRESGPAKAAEAKIEQEFSKRGKELQDMSARLKSMAEKLDKDAPVITESERIKRQRELTDLDQDFKRKQRIFNEDLNQRKNEEIAALVDRAVKAVKQIAEAEKYDIVLQDAVYFNPRVDITDKVLKALAK